MKVEQNATKYQLLLFSSLEPTF